MAALTTAGKIYTLPKQTGAPVADFMQRLTVRYTCATFWVAHLAETIPGVLLLVYSLSSFSMPQQLAHNLVVKQQQK